MHRLIAKIGRLTCDPGRRKLRCGGSVVTLTTKELAIFLLLASEPERLWQRREIRDKVWNSSSAVSLRTVDEHVSHIRKKLRLVSDEGIPWVQTVWSLGYRLRLSEPESR
jgi:DNA-binding response OmpR family regulator